MECDICKVKRNRIGGIVCECLHTWRCDQCVKTHRSPLNCFCAKCGNDVCVWCCDEPLAHRCFSAIVEIALSSSAPQMAVRKDPFVRHEKASFKEHAKQKESVSTASTVPMGSTASTAKSLRDVHLNWLSKITVPKNSGHQLTPALATVAEVDEAGCGDRFMLIQIVRR